MPRHLPCLRFLHGGHFFLAAADSVGETQTARPTPRRVTSTVRRERAARKERVRESKRLASIASSRGRVRGENVGRSIHPARRVRHEWRQCCTSEDERRRWRCLHVLTRSIQAGSRARGTGRIAGAQRRRTRGQICADQRRATTTTPGAISTAHMLVEAPVLAPAPARTHRGVLLCPG